MSMGAGGQKDIYKKILHQHIWGFGRGGREGSKPPQPGSTPGAPVGMKG